MHTRELIARQIFTKHIREGATRHKARFFVFCKSGIHIPFNEAKKLEREAKTINVGDIFL
jgi:hypothetical protein